MRLFLDDFIRAQSPTGRARAATLLASAKVNKAQLQEIANKLINEVQTGAITLPVPLPYDSLRGEVIRGVLADVEINHDKIFADSNNVSAVLDSLFGILSADIKSLEEELAAVEKSVDNYAFLLSDHGAYDYAYLEGFNDERGMDLSLSIMPDRGSRDFSLKDLAYVDPASGTLVISGNNIRKWPISNVSIIGTNVSTLIPESSYASLDNMVQEMSSNGWSASVTSPSVLTSNIEGYKESGVAIKNDDVLDGTDLAGLKFIIEFTLPSPQSCDTLTIDPMSDWDFIVSEILLYPSDSDDNVYYSPLNGAITIDRSKMISFPTQTVAKFRLYVRQATYKRQFDRSLDTEARNKKVFDELVFKNVIPPPATKKKQNNDNLPEVGPFSSYGWWDQRMLLWLKDQKDPEKQGSPYAVSIPKADYRKNWGAFSQRSNRLERRTFEASRSGWDNNDWVTRIVQDVIVSIAGSENIWGSVLNTTRQVKPAWDATANNMRADRMNRGISTEVSPNPGRVKDMGQESSPVKLPYKYKLGIKNVSIGTAYPNDRAVFISKRLEAPGEIGEVRLKVSEQNISIAGVNRDTPQVTSVEYSVSNLSNPVKENNWIPILPIDGEEVVGEKLIPDVTGKCFLRFPAKIDAPMQVYINGKKIIADGTESNTSIRLKMSDVIIPNETNQNIYAVKIPLSMIASRDILTIDYIPSRDFTTISFADANTDGKPPLASAYDDEGAGEGFTDSGGQLVIDLSHNPFVDPTSVEEATYDATTGLDGYSPVVVQFDDGTVAYNLTNYKGGVQSSLDSDSDNYQFIHTGNTLMFNKLVEKAFRVFYQFQPSDVRVRVVLRSNYNSYVTPSVDFFQLKAKTKKADVGRGI